MRRLEGGREEEDAVNCIEKGKVASISTFLLCLGPLVIAVLVQEKCVVGIRPRATRLLFALR